MKSLRKFGVFIGIFCVYFVFSTISCIFSTNPTNSDDSDALTDFSSDADTSDSAFFYTLSSDSSSITLPNLTAGQVILWANFNKGTSTISFSKVRATLSSSSNLNTSTSSSSGVVPYSSSSSSSGSSSGGAGGSRGRSVLDDTTDGSATSSDSFASLSDSSGESSANFAKIKHFVPQVSNKDLFEQAQLSNSSSRSVSLSRSVNSSPVTISNFTVGKLTKPIYIDYTYDLDSYKEASATLQAIGYDGGYTDEDSNVTSDAVCLVWVIDNYFSESGTSSGDVINSTVAHSLARKFAKYYSLEREIFGEESDYLINSSGYLDTTSMKYNSKTGNFVNIVVYDIGDDYGKEKQTGVVGYFYSKDYFETGSYSSSSVLNYTNAGKYFYIDSPFCNYDSNRTYSGTGDVSDTAITTLFHEFQHMIDFNNKDLNNLSSATWYNEMLSMLAEDVLATQLEIQDSDDAAWNVRMPTYNKYYYSSALDEYRSSDYAIYSYSTAYALGAYVARNYGGIKLIEEMSKNSYVNFESILKAIETVSGKSLSGLQLYKEVIAASVFRDGVKNSSTTYSFASTNNLPTFYKEQSASYSGTNLTLPKISIFSDDYGFSYNSKSSTSYCGPLIMQSGIVSSEGLRGHCFNIHYAGSVKSNGDVTLNFTSSSGNFDSNEQILIFVQDAFSNVVD